MSASNRSRKTNGLSGCARADGLIRCVIGPWKCPRVRCTIFRAGVDACTDVDDVTLLPPLTKAVQIVSGPSGRQRLDAGEPRERWLIRAAGSPVPQASLPR